MRISGKLVATGWALTLVACGGNGSSGNLDRFVAGCDESTNLGIEFCECAGKNAIDELSADGFAFLSASFDADQDELTTLRNELGPGEVISASMFMVSAYKKCAPEK